MIRHVTFGYLISWWALVSYCADTHKHTNTQIHGHRHNVKTILRFVVLQARSAIKNIIVRLLVRYLNVTFLLDLLNFLTLNVFPLDESTAIIFTMHRFTIQYDMRICHVSSKTDDYRMAWKKTKYNEKHKLNKMPLKIRNSKNPKNPQSQCGRTAMIIFTSLLW